jgi:glutathione S-transferase
MKLYYSKGACSLAVRIVIHELGVASEFESVNLKTKQTETGADFLQVNPKGTVPTLVVDKNEVLTENSVIQQYLADKHQPNQLLPAMDHFKRYHVLEWLNFISTDIHKGFGPFFNAKVSVEARNEIFMPILKNKFDYVNQHMAQNKYLMGDEFALPDAYMFVMLLWLPHSKMQLDTWSNLSRYFAELQQRKSIQQSLREEGLL